MDRYPVKTTAQFGPVLRGFRVQRGLTQVQLASAAGLSQKTISIAENFPDRLPLKHLLPILGVLGVDLSLQARADKPASKLEW